MMPRNASLSDGCCSSSSSVGKWAMQILAGGPKETRFFPGIPGPRGAANLKV